MATLVRGLISGAAGSSALNIVTYLDMAVRGRPESQLPAQDVERLTSLAGVDLGGDEQTAEHRKTALGSLLGYVSGLGIATAYAAAQPLLDGAPVPLRAMLVGAAAMAATDAASAALGVTDPRTWSATSWLSDAVPHLAYGAVTVVTHDALASERCV
jgi:hypothetical protein